MTAFKKSDSNQIEMVMAGIISLILIMIPVFFMLMGFDIIAVEYIVPAETIIAIGGAFLLIFLVMYFLKPENRYLSLLDIFILIEAASFVLSTIFAQNAGTAISGNEFTREGTVANLVYLLLLFCCSLLKNKKHRYCVYGSLIVVALFESFMGFMQTVVRYEPLSESAEIMEQVSYRAYGTLMNQNPYGAFMAIFAALEFGLFITAKKRWQMVVHAILALIFAVCVMFSGTRGAMVGLGFAVIFFGIIILVGICRKKEYAKGAGKRSCFVLLIAVIAVGIATLLSSDTVKDTAERVASEATTTSVDALGSGRVGLWKRVLNEWEESPILGLGVSNLKLVYISGGYLWTVYVAHNEFLDILATRGIVGLVTYLALMLYVFIFAMRKLFRNGVKNSKDLFGLLLAFVTYMATAFFGWRIIYLTPYFYVMVGLMVSREESKRILLMKK